MVKRYFIRAMPRCGFGDVLLERHLWRPAAVTYSSAKRPLNEPFPKSSQPLLICRKIFTLIIIHSFQIMFYVFMKITRMSKVNRHSMSKVYLLFPPSVSKPTGNDTNFSIIQNIWIFNLPYSNPSSKCVHYGAIDLLSCRWKAKACFCRISNFKLVWKQLSHFWWKSELYFKVVPVQHRQKYLAFQQITLFSHKTTAKQSRCFTLKPEDVIASK